MDKTTWQRHKRHNTVQSAALLFAMAALLGLLGWVLLGGWIGLALACGVAATLFVFSPNVAPKLILRMYRARRLTPRNASGLTEMLDELSRRAELPIAPTLHYIPSRMINAFAVGTPEQSAVALTDGLLRTLTPREVAGVLAHEVSHIRHFDTRAMGLADMFSRLTGTLSSIGQILLLVNLPLVLLSSAYTISWTAIVLLLLAPTIASMMQLALSRTREFDADLGAAALTGDPEGLASALAKMERYQGRFFEQIVMPGRKVPEPSMLRSHPPTAERIERLLEVRTGSPAPKQLPGPAPDGLINVHDRIPVVARPPRWRVMGLWY
ncbi:MAG: M48 family metalloprotease [Gammaproteobacteria bacterium]|nr:M48 family metalloprotease [Gammaproteobacteria bacterium]